MRELELVCLQLEKFSPFPKTNKWFYRHRSILLFFMYIASVAKPTFMMKLNRAMDILWQTVATRSAWTYKLTFFETNSTTCNGNALFTENKLYELHNLCNGNKGLICRGLMRRNTTFSLTWLRKYFLSPVTKVYARETTTILRIFEFTKFSHFIV